MPALQNKIDFSVLFTVTHANPNGDPLNGNRPRENYEGCGEISDVCIKRKIRNRLQDMGENIFVQSDDRRGDEYNTLKKRFDSTTSVSQYVKGKKTDKIKCHDAACKEWIDVRGFGQVFPFKGKEDSKNKESGGVSLGVRGPISIQNAVSVSPIDIVTMQITKSVSNEGDGDSKSSDTMGLKHYVSFGLYVFHGSINCQLAEKTGFSNEDALKIKEALCTLFDNDASSARPEGSMEVCRVYWWKHDSKTPKYSSAKVHRQLQIHPKEGIDTPRSFNDYEIKLNSLEGLNPEIIELI